MTSITFDTMSYSNTLQDAGIPKTHADALAKANLTAFETMVDVKQLATKDDIKNLQHEMEIIRHELKLDIATSKHEVLKWMVTGMVAQAALLVGIIAFLK